MSDHDIVPIFARKCDECGHVQEDKHPGKWPTVAYTNRKCKNCKSEALDYGHYGYTRDKTGKLSRIELDMQE